jgi:histidinol phosphatase-like PHP family hydrolase
VDSIDAADAAAASGRVRDVPGFGPAKEANLRERIAAWRRLAARVPRFRALPLAEALVAAARRETGDESLVVAGDLRAGCCEVEAIEIECTAPETHAHRADSIDGVAVRFVAAADPLPGVPWEIRHLPDRLSAWRDGTFQPVEEADFRGQLHEHTTWSDGKAGVAEMAEAALARGYAYLAITDHSRSLTIANGLSRDRLLAQLDEVEALRAEYAARGLAILTGLEADILADGSLDMDDDVLERLDVVVASVHIRHKEDRDAMTRRIATAIANPRCDILGHPTGRLLGRREGYPVDMDAVIAAAVAHGKALEINASPERMDLDDHWVRRGREAGAVFSVNADAHSTAGLGLLPWGLCMARRGGLAAGDVINTWPLERLRAWTASHRAGVVGGESG